MSEHSGIVVATSGWRSRPSLTLSRGALDRFSYEELRAVIRHEHAHWQRGRWLLSHVLFAFRLVQAFNPVALWLFREYTTELEIDCDREAVHQEGRRELAKALLAVYAQTDGPDLAARAILRKRIDVLLGRISLDQNAVPTASIGIAAALLLAVLPWIS